MARAARRAIANSEEAPTMLIQKALARPRPRYYLCKTSRPVYRGWMMAELLHGGEWLFAVTLYMAVATALGPHDNDGMAIRAVFCMTTLWNLHVSDLYHNYDHRVARGTSEMEAKIKELGFLRKDYVSISMILTASHWLWANNLQWVDYTWWTACAAIGATLAVASCASFGLTDHLVRSNPDHETLNAVMEPWQNRIQMLFGFQFFILLGRLRTNFAASAFPYAEVVFLVYVVGFAAQKIKYFKFAEGWQTFGPHEYFHLMICAGHLTTMTCDVAQLSYARPEPLSASVIEALRSVPIAPGWANETMSSLAF